MDNSDHDIEFDQAGVCSHCFNYNQFVKSQWPFYVQNEDALFQKITEIKRINKNAKYDCVLGISGGVDSSYLALKAYEWGLRVLLVHVDAGWNNELAVNNIEKISKYCGFDLHTKVIDWQSMRLIQIAFLKSGIANQDIPQDHIFVSETLNCAKLYGVKTVLSGGNFSTEGVYPKSWESSELDSININAIIKNFSDKKPRDYKVLHFLSYYFLYPFVYRIKSVRLLNYIDYKKDKVIKELVDKVEWKPYPRKHGESRFTRFFQDHFLIERFGYDKRKPHFSSLINSNQMTREEALNQLSEPLFGEAELKREKEYIAKKLLIETSDIDSFIAMPLRKADEYPNWNRYYAYLQKLRKFVEKMLKTKIQ